jgi:penicillin-insensitive murein endopeptidase
MRRSIALAAVCLALTVAAIARATPGDEGGPRPRSGTRRAAPSRSIGLPFDGRLQNGVLLRESAHVRYAGEYRAAGHFWGTEELVRLIERAAAHVAKRIPGARLSVGELSARRGGPLAGHRSHQNGRDADLSFYILGAEGRPFDPFGFASFDRHGHGLPPNEPLRFDDARNWELVARLVSDPDARVQYIFVANTLRRRLLATARRRRAPASVFARAAAVMVEPPHGHPHRNHFHVRIYCPPADRPSCRDREPFHPWYPGTPPTPAEQRAGAGAPAH